MDLPQEKIKEEEKDKEAAKKLDPNPWYKRHQSVLKRAAGATLTVGGTAGVIAAVGKGVSGSALEYFTSGIKIPEIDLKAIEISKVDMNVAGLLVIVACAYALFEISTALAKHIKAKNESTEKTQNQQATPSCSDKLQAGAKKIVTNKLSINLFVRGGTGLIMAGVGAAINHGDGGTLFKAESMDLGGLKGQQILAYACLVAMVFNISYAIYEYAAAKAAHSVTQEPPPVKRNEDPQSGVIHANTMQQN